MSAAVILGAATALGTASLGAITAPLTMPTRRPHDRTDLSARPAITDRTAAVAGPGRHSSLRSNHVNHWTPGPPTHPQISASTTRHLHPSHDPGAAGWAALLDRVSTHLRSGESLITAWSAALDEYPVRGEAVAPGRSLADTAAASTSDADEAVVVQAVTAAMALGGPMAATLDAAAAMLRERNAIRAEAAAHSAQARLSARVLTAVPLVFAAWSSATSASFRDSLGTPVGFACLLLGALLNLVGWRWMRRIVAGASR